MLKNLKTLLLTLLIIGTITSVFAFYGLSNRWVQVVDEQGVPIISGLTFEVQAINSGSAATIYSDDNATAKTNSTTLASDGILSFYYTPATYDLQIGDGADTYLYEDLTATDHKIVFTKVIDNETSIDIDGGSIDGTPIGATTPSTGAFTTLTAVASSFTGALTIGDGGDTVAINSSDWDIGATGDVTGLGAIGADGLITFTNATDASSLTAGAVVLSGGLAVAKQLYLGDDLDMSVSGTGVYDITLKDSVADALSIVRGSTDMIVFNTSTPLITITPNTDVVGDLTAGTVTSDAGVGGTLITASTGFVLGDGDYIGITSNEIITFNAAGTIVASGADFHVGGTATDNLTPDFKIVGDADSDGTATTSETLTVALTANATPTSATWAFTSTQSAGYSFDKAVTINGDITGYITPHALFIGTDADATGSGIPLAGASWDTAQGVGIYGDDGGVALVGYTEVMTVRMLTTVAVASGDVSTVPFHTDLTLNANYTGTGGLSSIWGNTTIKSGKTIDTSGGLGDVGGATFGIDIVGVLAANSHACGVSVGVGGSGTKTGILTGYRIRGATGTVDWDGVLSIEDGDGSWTSMTQATASETATMTNGPTGTSGNPDYWMKMYIGSDVYVTPWWKI